MVILVNGHFPRVFREPWGVIDRGVLCSKEKLYYIIFYIILYYIKKLAWGETTPK